MATNLKFYAHNTSVSFKGDVFQPGEEIPLDVVRAIPRQNLHILLQAGTVITHEQKQAIDEAKRIADAAGSDRLPPIGCGADKFIDELHLNHGPTGAMQAGVSQLKATRGDAPVREIDEFLDGKDEDFRDDPAPEAEDDTPADIREALVDEDEESSDFQDEPAPEGRVDGEEEDPLDEMFRDEE